MTNDDDDWYSDFLAGVCVCGGGVTYFEVVITHTNARVIHNTTNVPHVDCYDGEVTDHVSK